MEPVNTSVPAITHLKLGVTSTPLYATVMKRYKNGTVDIAGAATYIASIVFALPGVTLEYYSPKKRKMNEGHRSPNGTWSGIFGQLQRNEIDVFLGPIFTQDTRLEGFQYLNPYIYDSVCFLVSGEVGRMKSFFSFLTNVDKRIWVLLVFSFLVNILLCSLADTFENINSRNVRRGLEKYLWMYLGALFCEGSPKSADRRTSQMLLFLWLFACILMSTIMTGMFLAVLTIKSPDEVIENLEELAAKEEMTPTTPIEYKNVLTESQLSYVRVLGKRAEDRGGVISLEQLAVQEIYQRVKDGKVALTLPRLVGQTLIQLYCSKVTGNRKMYYVDDSIGLVSLAFLQARDYPAHLTKRFNQRLRIYLENGLDVPSFRSLTKNYWKCNINNNKLKMSLKVEHLDTVFYLTLECLVIAFMVFILEISYYITQKSRTGRVTRFQGH